MTLRLQDINPNILNKFGTDPVGTTGDEIIYLCPFCEENGKTEDTKGHLYVNNRNLLYFCHRCGSKGKVSQSSVRYEYDPIPSDMEMFELLDSVVGDSYERPEEDWFPIPPDLVEPTSKCGTYLTNRGVTPDVVRLYSIRQGTRGRQALRVIVPNRIETVGGREFTDMYVARYCDDIPRNAKGKAAFPKYLNPPGADKNKVVFNLHRIPKGSPIILCEGVFSAISAGRNAVAIYGKTISRDQLSMILSNSPSKLYVCLDPDARREALSLCHRLCRTSAVPVYNVELPEGHDPNSLGHGAFMRYLVSTERFDPVERGILNLAG